MAAIETDPNTVHGGCNYYLMCKINDNEWECIIDNAFILHTRDRKLYGQFLSSAWFKKHISVDDGFDLLIIRLPCRDINVHSNEQATLDILRQQLNGAINYDILDFVVIHKHYRRDITKYTCNILNEDLTKDETRSVITDNAIFGVPNYTNINLTFEAVRVENDHNNTSQDICQRPHLTRNDGSWNTYRNSLLDTEVKFYITCPHFTLNID